MADDTSHPSDDENLHGTFRTFAVTSVDERRCSSQEQVLELMAEADARTVLDYLENSSTGITTIQELAMHLGRETGTGNPPDRVVARLHHVVLPKLADANIVDYDREANTVQYIGHPFVEASLNLFQNT